jgi:hypothetical protein
MSWVETAVTALTAIVVMAIIILLKRPSDDLGYVSAHWIAELRRDTTQRQAAATRSHLWSRVEAGQQLRLNSQKAHER